MTELQTPAKGLGPGITPEAVLRQLEKVLESSGFRNSKRYAAILRYIVDRTLSGDSEQVKERTIGVDVFGRRPDYDTASDHVVRSAMSEVRKRLAGYYADPSTHGDLRIDLQPGSYVPQFLGAAEAPVVVPEPLVPLTVEVQENEATPKRTKWWIGLALVAVTVIAATVWTTRPSPSALDRFWGPVMRAQGTVLLCIGTFQGGLTSPPPPNTNTLSTMTMSDFHHDPHRLVHFVDAAAMARFAGLMQGYKKPYQLVTQSDADFADMRNGPAVLIGLMNNDWTARLVGQLRFHAEKPAPRTVVIRDSLHPERNDWAMAYATPLLEITRDYALVLRVLDPKTDQIVVTAAGISVFGTAAASDFLTSEREMQALADVAPGGWEKKNLEIVLSTDVINGKSGRPKVVATHVW